MDDQTKNPAVADSQPSQPAANQNPLPDSPPIQPVPGAQPTTSAPAATAPQPDQPETAPAPAVAPTPPLPTPTPVASSQTPLNPISGNQPHPAPEEPKAQGSLQNVANGFYGVFSAIFSWFIFPLAIVLILHNFVFQAYHVLGTSMVPTLHETDYLIISKVGYTEALIGRMLGKDDKYIPKRGQIIVFHYPKDPTKIFVKRVIALPGERIVVKNGQVTVYNKTNPNGFDPDTNYESSTTVTLIDTDETVQPGNIFVMGDNRTPGGSYDSREWGELPSSYIIGDAVMRLLPLDQAKIF